MKKLILLLIIGFIINNPNAYSQSISGKVSVSGFNKDGIIKEKTAVELFKSFKENTYNIGFKFQGWGTYPPQQPLIFDMTTTVKKNGKVIGSSSRPGWPWLPGDMFVPAEAFDFIPILQKDGGMRMKGRKINTLSGSYEIILEMKISSGQGIDGKIEPVTIYLKY